jgi:predicted RNase H-like HicB family nuclease
MPPTFHVWAKWDDEAQVWYTAQTSIRGLNSSGDTLEELRQRLMLLIPDFLEDQMPAHAVLHIIAERDDDLTPVAAE